MESLQDWGLLGEIYIGCGFIRGKLAGIYYDILGRVCDRLAGGRGLVQGFGSTPTRRGIVCNRLRRREDYAGYKARTPTRRGPTFL